MTQLEERPRFKPWVGTDYSESGLRGLRVLLLGESHYTDERAPRRTITQEVVQRYGVGGKKKAFFTKAMKAVDPRSNDSPEKRAAFWNSVAYYVYIQESVGSGPRESPTERAWNSAAAPFSFVLADLKPHAVIVLGKRLWSHLPAPAKSTMRTVDDAATMAVVHFATDDSRRALAASVTHPAGAISYKIARPRIRALLDEADRHRQMAS